MIKNLLAAISAISAVLLGAVPAAAQIYVSGDEPGFLRWSQRETSHYRIIYPRGLDSLAKAYGQSLEAWLPAEAATSGFTPGQNCSRKTPVILHGYSSTSNGGVVWAPKRMELYTMESPYYSLGSIDWMTSLTIHEQRHLAQMQFGCGWPWKFGSFIFGQIFPGALSGIYPGPAFLEGDAVAAETALTSAGRGRSADFLSYMRVAFDNGDWRDYYRWVYGSQRYYAPDYYRAGYMLISGMRHFYSQPEFTKDYFHFVNTGLRFGALPKTMRKASGMSLRETFRAIEEGYHEEWAQQEAERKPSTVSTPVTAFTSAHTDYSGLANLGGGKLAAVRSGISEAAKLVVMDTTGNILYSRPFSYSASNLYADTLSHRIYWSETVAGTRWSLATKIRAYYAEYGDDGRVGPFMTFHRDGRHSSPVPSPDGKHVALVSHPYEGGTVLEIYSSEGVLEDSYSLPGVQIIEPCWKDGEVWFSGLSKDGNGIWKMHDSVPVLSPTPSSISSLTVGPDGNICFISDRGGTGELYCLSGTAAEKLTSTPYGIIGPVVTAGGEIYYTMQGLKGSKESYRAGTMVYKTPVSSLRPLEEGASRPYAIADDLSSQEAALGYEPPASDTSAYISEPEPYSKIGHAVRFHSWAPFYFSFDNVASSSYDDIYSKVGIGAVAMFQNDLGSFYGTIGYSYHDNEYDSSDWRHSGHLTMTYSGLPVAVDFNLDVNDRQAFSYRYSALYNAASDSLITVFVNRTQAAKTRVKGSLRLYVPLDFSSHGWYRGLIPSVSWHFNNDRYSAGIDRYRTTVLSDGSYGDITYVSTGGKPSSHGTENRLTFSLRGYIMRGTASSQVYPRFGIGAEAGYRTYINYDKIMPPTAFGYIYMYLPGLFRNQGLRLTAIGQKFTEDGSLWGSNTVNVVPRGLDDSYVDDYLSIYSSSQAKFTADYAIPIWVGDISALSPVAYIRNFVLTPHFDYTVFEWSSLYSGLPSGTGGLWSAGASLTAHLGNLLWLPYDTSIGIDYCYNGGHDYSRLDSYGADLSRSAVSVIFSIDF